MRYEAAILITIKKISWRPGDSDRVPRVFQGCSKSVRQPLVSSFLRSASSPLPRRDLRFARYLSAIFPSSRSGIGPIRTTQGPLHAHVNAARGINQTLCPRIPTVAADRSAFVPRYDSQRPTSRDVLIVPPKHSWLVTEAPPPRPATETRHRPFAVPPFWCTISFFLLVAVVSAVATRNRSDRRRSSFSKLRPSPPRRSRLSATMIMSGAEE